MNKTEPKGCLGAILGLFGIKPGGQAAGKSDLPYRLRDDFLSPAELAFYRVLTQAVGGQAVICTKVNLADIFFVPQSKENHSFRNKIDRKHVDFLLCEPATMKPRCGIELDDSSHDRRDRQERDAFVDQVFKVAKLPLIHVPARASYDAATLLASIERELNNAKLGVSTPPARPTGDGIPNCPKCRVPMVKRVASKGQTTGKAFFGCPNYPKCREVVQI